MRETPIRRTHLSGAEGPSGGGVSWTGRGDPARVHPWRSQLTLVVLAAPAVAACPRCALPWPRPTSLYRRRIDEGGAYA